MTDDVSNKKMVVGFLFRENTVLLVQKEKPSWQKGLLNGVGGVMNSDETPLAAMCREFREETQYPHELEWRHFATEIEPFGAYVYFFTARYREVLDGYLWPSRNDVDEMLLWLTFRQRYENRSFVGSLSWLIPLALDPGDLSVVTVERSGDIRENPTW